MNSFEADDAYSQDNLFVEIKTDIDEFIHVLSNNPVLAELKGQVDTMFQALESQYSNVNMTQRQIIDVRTKLKTNVKNKTEVTKSIEDDLERFETLKKECENYNLKIDQVKFEEEEKEKKLIDQKIEISRLIQKKENDTLANFSAKDVARKQELNSEKDKLELELKETQDKKEQAFDKTYKLNLEKNDVEKLCQQKRKQLLDLEKQKLELEKQIAAAKLLKDKTDIEFKNLKLDSTNKEEQLKRLNKETETYMQEKKKLATNKENKDAQIKDIKGQIQLLQNKKIPQINHEKIENEEKEKKLREQIKDLIEENDAKTKEIRDIDKEARAYKKKGDEYQKKIDKYNLKLDDLLEKIKIARNEGMNLENDIRKKENEFTKKKSELTKGQKDDATENQKLEKLAEKVFEIKNQIAALNGANRRMEIKIRGMKNETLELDKEQTNAEKEKNLCAKLASDANMDHTQALEKLKKLNEAIAELKQKNIDSESKLKQQKKIYDALKADSKKFEKKFIEAQSEIQILEDDKIKKDAKYNALKKDLVGKQEVLKKTETKLQEFQDAVEKHIKVRDELKNECTAFKENIERYVENINSLQKMISQAEQDLQNQKKEMNVVLSERDFLSEQLIQRNEEIKGLYEKIKSLQQEEVKMHQQYEKLLLEIESNRSTRDYLIEEYEKTENIIKNIFDLKVVKIKLEKEVLIAKNKVRSLEDETKKHLNIHRWTKLEYSDPEKFELIQQINSLQRRLNAKTEEVTKKEEIIQEKEKLYIKLKHIVARQSGLDMEEPLSKYKAKIKEEGQRLKKLKEEIKNYRLEIKNYEYEIKRIVGDTEKLKKAWFKRLDEQGGFTNELLREAENQDNLEENQQMENEEGNGVNEQEGENADENGYDDDENGRDNNVQEDENENFDENGQQFEGEYNDDIMQNNLQQQGNRPKYNSA